MCDYDQHRIIGLADGAHVLVLEELNGIDLGITRMIWPRRFSEQMPASLTRKSVVTDAKDF
jgi:hypothetical protein